MQVRHIHTYKYAYILSVSLSAPAGGKPEQCRHPLSQPHCSCGFLCCEQQPERLLCQHSKIICFIVGRNITHLPLRQKCSKIANQSSCRSFHPFLNCKHLVLGITWCCKSTVAPTVRLGSRAMREPSSPQQQDNRTTGQQHNPPKRPISTWWHPLLSQQ